MARPLTVEQVIERLYEDERLRAELDDAEAKIMLDWAVAEVEAADKQGRPLAPVVDHIRTTSRAINDLVAERGRLDQAHLADRLRALAELPQPRLNRLLRRLLGRSDAVDELLGHIDRLDGPDYLQTLLSLAPSLTRPKTLMVPPSRTGLYLTLTILILGCLLIGTVIYGFLSVRSSRPPIKPGEIIVVPKPDTGRPVPPTLPAPPAAGPGAPVEVYFTSPRYPDRPAERRGGIDERLTQLLLNATRTIDMAIYDLDLANVTAAMLDARRRGVRVRVVTDSDNVQNAAIQQLKTNGVPVVEDRRQAIMHHKFAVIDGSSVWMGSWNFTVNDTYRYNNHGALWHNQPLADNYTAEFEKMFNGKFGSTKPKGIPYPVIMADGIRIETYFASEIDPAPMIVRRIQGAERTITFMAFQFTHDRIGQAMVERSQHGVAVQGIFETVGSDTKYSEYGRLKEMGLDVVTDGNAYLMHHKVIVIDEKTVIFGSFNFSSNAADNNDENCLIVDDPSLARHFLEEYLRLHQLALNPARR